MPPGSLRWLHVHILMGCMDGWIVCDRSLQATHARNHAHTLSLSLILPQSLDGCAYRLPSSVFDSLRVTGLFSFVCQDLEGACLPRSPGHRSFLLLPSSSAPESATEETCGISNDLLSPRTYCLLGGRDMKLIDAPHDLHGWEVRDGYRWTGPTRRPGGRVILLCSRRAGTAWGGMAGRGSPVELKERVIVGGGRESG